MAAMKVGSVHGRFQPFHNGHLDYVMQAFALADHIKIGLTQIYQPRSQVSDDARNQPNSNPLAFWERATLIEAALLEAGVPRNRFEFVPFPIETPDRIPEFLAPGVTCYTTIVSDWNHKKISVLSDLGYPVEVLRTSLPDNNRVTSGSEVRRLIRLGTGGWSRYVAPSVAELIDGRFRHRF